MRYHGQYILWGTGESKVLGETYRRSGTITRRLRTGGCHGYREYASALEHHTVRRHAAFNCNISAGKRRVVGEAPAACRPVLVGDLPRALHDILRHRRSHLPVPRDHRPRLRPVHHLAFRTVRRRGRHPHQRHDSRHDEEQRHPARHRHVPRKLGRHDGRGDAAHPSRPAREFLATQQDPHRRVLHFPRSEHRRLLDPHRRSPAVPWLSARRTVLLDAPAHLADSFIEHRRPTGRIRSHRSPLRQERGQRGKGGARSRGGSDGARSDPHRRRP